MSVCVVRPRGGVREKYMNRGLIKPNAQWLAASAQVPIKKHMFPSPAALELDSAVPMLPQPQTFSQHQLLSDHPQRPVPAQLRSPPPLRNASAPLDSPVFEQVGVSPRVEHGAMHNNNVALIYDAVRAEKSYFSLISTDKNILTQLREPLEVAANATWSAIAPTDTISLQILPSNEPSGKGASTSTR